MIKKRRRKRRKFTKKTLEHLKIIKKNLTVAIIKTVLQPTQPKKKLSQCDFDILLTQQNIEESLSENEQKKYINLIIYLPY